MTALAALTERVVRVAMRDDLPFAVLSPAASFVVFNFMLSNVIDTGGMSYPQYVLPVVIIQVIFMGALTTVDRAARDERERLRGSASHASHIHGDTDDGPHVVLPLPGHSRSARRDRCRVRVRLPNVRRVRLCGGFCRSYPHVDAGAIARGRRSRGSFRSVAEQDREQRRAQLSCFWFPKCCWSCCPPGWRRSTRSPTGCIRSCVTSLFRR